MNAPFSGPALERRKETDSRRIRECEESVGVEIYKGDVRRRVKKEIKINT